jgi:hypothetical protein
MEIISVMDASYEQAAAKFIRLMSPINWGRLTDVQRTPTWEEYETDPLLRRAIKAILRSFPSGTPYLHRLRTRTFPYNDCFSNTAEYCTTHEGSMPCRGFKVRVCEFEGNIIGVKAEGHVLVRRQSGKYHNTQVETDDAILFVPAHLSPNITDDQLLSVRCTNAYVFSGAFVYGSSKYTEAIIGLCKIFNRMSPNVALQMFETPGMVKIVRLHVPVEEEDDDDDLLESLAAEMDT